MSKKIEIFKLEDRVLFEAAAVAEIVEAMENDPNANMNENDRQAQEERDAVKNAPVENAAAQGAQPDMSDPSDKSDIDAEIQALVEGEIGFSEAASDAVGGLLNEYGANAVDEAIQQVFEQRNELVEFDILDSDAAVSTGNELVIINSSVNDADEIIAELAANQEVLVLESGRDAFEQINEFLEASGKNYSAIHIMSHGDEGYFILNGEMVSENNFNAGNWAAIGEHMTADGDIMLYGCNLAANDSGQHLVSMIADASGADVAASTDSTGLNGNWDLEYTSGQIETSSITVENYNYSLETYTVRNLNDSGAGSLREGLSNVENTDIVFDVTDSTGQYTIYLQSELNLEAYAAKTLTINGANNGNAITLDGGDSSRIFAYDKIANSINLTVSNMTMVNGNAGTGDGGTIYINAHTVVLKLNKVEIKDSEAVNGGAIYLNSVTGAVTLNPYNTQILDTTGAEAVKIISASTVTFDVNTPAGQSVISGSNGDGLVIESQGNATVQVGPNGGSFTVEKHDGDGIKVNAGGSITFSSTTSGMFYGQDNDGWGVSLKAQGNITLGQGLSSAYTFSGNDAGGLQAIAGGDFNYASGNGNGLIAHGNDGVGIYLETGGNVTYASKVLNIEDNKSGIVIDAGGDVSLDFSGTSSTVYIADHAEGGLMISAGGNVSFSSTGFSLSGNSTYGILVNATGNIMFALTGTNVFSGNSSANGGAWSLNADGNIDVKLGAVYTDNTSFTGNKAAVSGGAIYLNAAGNAKLEATGKVTLTGNEAVTDGGAVYMNAGKAAVMDLGIHAYDDEEGGLLGSYIAFESNTAGRNGGAIYANSTVGDLTLSMGEAGKKANYYNVEFKGNTATAGSGGAIYGGNGGISILATQFDGNSAALLGGAVYHVSGALSLGGSRVTGNNSNGGVVYGGGSVKVKESIVYGNHDLAFYAAGNMISENTTFYDNTGGAAQVGGNLQMVNTTVTGNTAAQAVNVQGDALIINSILTDNSAGNLSVAGSLDMAHSIYGQAADIANLNASDTIQQLAGASVFDGLFDDVNGIYKVQSGIIGVLTGAAGGSYVYAEGGQWRDVAGNIVANAVAVSKDQINQGRSIVDSNIGAHQRSSYVAWRGDSDDILQAYEFYTTIQSGINSVIQYNLDNTEDDNLYISAATIVVNTALTVNGDIRIFGTADADGNRTTLRVDTTYQESQTKGDVARSTNLLFNISGGTAQLNDMTLIGGYRYNAHGGSMYIGGTGTDVTLNNITMSEGYAASGGAVFADTGTTLTINDSKFFVNKFNNAGRGGAVVALGNLTVNGSKFVDNGNGGYGTGGAVYYNNTADWSITDSIFRNNVASSGGGAVYSTGGGTLTVNGNTDFSGNSGSGNGGGAIYILDGTLNVGMTNSAGETVTFTGNKGVGGAIRAAGTNELNVSNTVFTGNSSAGNGGTLFIEADAAANIYSGTEFKAGSVSGNHASSSGGAIYNLGTMIFDTGSMVEIDGFRVGSNGGAIWSSGTITFNDAVTISGNETINTSTGGAGIYNTGTITFLNTLTVSNNIGRAYSPGTGIYNSGDIVFWKVVTLDGNQAGGGAKGNGLYNIGSATFKDIATISNNIGTGNHNWGAGLYNGDTGTVVFEKAVTVSGNSGAGGSISFGGGGISNAGSIDFQDVVTITGNKSNMGGGVHNTGTLTFAVSSTISGNSGGGGGGIANVDGGTIVLKDGVVLTIKDNTGNSGGGLYVNCDFSFSGQFIFENNYASGNGGAVYSTDNNTLTIGHNSLFTENYAGQRGGGVYKTGGTLNIGKDGDTNGSSAVFTGNYTSGSNNAAYGGGAVYVVGAATLNVHGVIFENNRSNSRGGVIYAYANTTSHIDDETVFINTLNAGGTSINNASSGGVIYNAGTMILDVKDGTEFSDYRVSASGGVIYNDSTGIFTLNGNETVFADNYAGSYGGVIYNAGTLTIENESEFTGNTAKARGGAIHTSGNLFLNDKAVFTGNYAVAVNGVTGWGGAICAEGANTLNLAHDTEFTGNYAVHGGAIYRTGGTLNIGTADGAKGSATFTGNYTSFGTSTSYGGGVIYVTSAVLNVYGATFEDNTTTGGGGAIYANTGVTSYINDKTVFINNLNQGGTTLNHGTYAGLLYNAGTMTLDVKDGTEFKDYRVSIYAGVIYNVGTFTLNGKAVFEDNYSAQQAGAIYNGSNGIFNLSAGAVFENNKAGTWGGAILNSGRSFTITDAKFLTNTAGYGGGAIRNTGTMDITNSTFDTNSTNGSGVGYGGGAISNTGTMSITESVFDTNSTKGQGGGAIRNAGSLTIDSTSFLNNTNSNTGGGAIWNGSKLTVTNSLFEENSTTTTGAIGGAIYNNSGTMYIGTSTFTGNSGFSHSGAISVNSGTNTIVNSTFYNNTAEGYQGGAIYFQGTATVGYIIDCTIVGNSAKSGSGGIFVNNAAIRVEIYNSIITGNYLTGNYQSKSDIAINGTSATVSMAYSIYGSLSGNADVVKSTVSSDMGDLFNAEWNGTEYVNKDTGLSVLQDGVIAINKHGQAAYSGTLVGYVDKTVDVSVSVDGVAPTVSSTTAREYFYRDFTLGESGEWKSFSGESYAFDEFAANYGLPGAANGSSDTVSVDDLDPNDGSVISTTETTTTTNYASGVVTTAQNKEANGDFVSRVQTQIQYNVGAYALPFEQASWTVDTDSSVINVFDGAHSLSEIMRFYVNYDPSTQQLYSGTAHITFAIEEFTLLGDLEVAVNAEQFITKNITMNGYNDVTDTDLQGNVTLIGNGNRLFSTNDAAADWTLKFSNINLQGGDAGTGNGGALDVNGRTVDLTLDHVKVLDSLGANGGGVAVNASNSGLLTVTHSEFRGNEATANGGAVYASGVAVSMDNSLFALNEAAVAGGAIHLASAVTGTLTNLTVANNTAASGGGISAGGSVNVRNSILWGNSGGQYSGSMQFANSAIQGWTGTGNGNIKLADANAGANGINANDNASGVYYVCFTSDYHLGDGSYLINRGNNAYAASATDLGDKGRIQKGTVDMGAYESGNKGNVVIWANGADIIYGDTATLQAGHDGTGGGSFSYSGGDGYLTFNGSDATAIKAKTDGGHQVTATYSGDDNWNSETTTITVNTLQRHLTVTANPGQTKVYGDADPAAYTYTYSNLVTGDSLTGALGRAAGENAGSYWINLGSLDVSDGNNGDNYIIDYTGANFVITKAVLTVTADANQSKVYGDADPAYSYTVSGLKNGDRQADVLNNGALDRAVGENVGLYGILQGTLDLASGNYTLNYVGNDFEITKATLTVTANDWTKVYGGDDPASYAYTVSGLKNGDRQTNVLNNGTLERELGENVGVYDIRQGTLDLASGNYTLDFVEGEFTITQATLTVTVDAGQGKVYGDADPGSYTYTVSGLKNGDLQADVLNNGALDRISGENAGLYEILQGSLDLASTNYTLSFVENNFEITKAVLTVTADANQTKVYGTSDPSEYTYSVSGLKNGDLQVDVLNNGALDRAAGENAGLYGIQQGTLDLSSGNYTLDYIGSDFEITKATLTITANADQTKVYGTSDPSEYTYEVSGLVAGDSMTGALDRAAGENTGSYGISQGSLGVVTGGDNYTVIYNGDSFTITKATLTITVDAGQNKVYGTGEPSGYTYDVNGLVAGDSMTGELSRDAGENVGTYAINQNTLDVVTGGDNYIIDYVGGDFEITKATLTITVDAGQGKVYGTSDPSEYTYDVSGLVAGDSLSGELSRDAGENAGTYAINQGSLNVVTGGDNYIIDYVGGDFEITKATLTITVDAGQGKVYGTSDPSEYTYDVSGLVAGDSLSGELSRDAGENAGTYAINQNTLNVVTAGDNYIIDYVGGNFEITKATLTITVDAGQGKVYGTSEPSEYTYDVNGLVSGDSLSGELSRDAGENAGTYAINQGTLDVVTAGDNYIIDYVGGNFEITKATLTITVDAGQGKVYGTSNPVEYTYDADGLASWDSLSGELSRDAGENAGTYAINQGTLDVVTAGDNYTVVFEGDNFEITKATLTITVDAGQGKVYGTSDPAEFTYTYDGLVAGDSLTGELSREAGKNAGKYAIGQNTLDVVTGGDNYTVVFEGDNFEITQATLTVIRDGADKVYDGTTAADYNVTLDGLVDGDAVTYEKGDATFEDKHVGNDKEITIAGDKIGGADLTNYEVFWQDSGADISRADLNIYINDAVKNTGETDPQFTWSDNAKDGDTVSGVERTDKGELPGQYAIDQCQVEDGNGGNNYNINVRTGTLTINEAGSNVLKDAATRQYVINGMSEAALINNVSAMTANRDVDAVLDTETDGNVHSASHQTVAKAGEKAKTNLREDSQKKTFEEANQEAAQNRNNTLLVKSDTSNGEKTSIVESQYKTSGQNGRVQVQMPVSDFSTSSTSFESDHPMHNMPSNISIDNSGTNVVNFSGLDLADVTIMEKADNLKDPLDHILEEMLLV